jgi:citrate synthase
MSWPDSRIWCNQIGALAGSAGTKASSGCVAGVLASDSILYGPGSLPACMEFISSAVIDKQSGLSIRGIIDKYARWHFGSDGIKKPQLPGYARPVARGDERVISMKKESRKLGFPISEHEQLSDEIARYLQKNFNEDVNIGGYTVAFLVDQGINSTELYRFSVNRVSAGVQACYSEAADNPGGSFLPLRCDDIEYTGKAPRLL